MYVRGAATPIEGFANSRINSKDILEGFAAGILTQSCNHRGLVAHDLRDLPLDLKLHLHLLRL